jgi:hypothetical protein
MSVIRHLRNIFAPTFIGALAIDLLLTSAVYGTSESAKKHYWATSLSGIVDEAILVGLHEVREARSAGSTSISAIPLRH